LAAFCALTGVLMLLPAPASAYQLPYVPAGTLSGSPEPLVHPVGVAINQETGNVYVADQGTGKIEQYSAAGVWQSEFALGAPSEVFLEGVAVDNSGGSSQGDVYVANGSGVVYKLDPSITGALSFDPLTPKMGEGTGTTGVAVGPNGNVYVLGADLTANTSAYVEEFSPTGVLLNPRKIGPGNTEGYLAVDSSGNIYVTTFGGTDEYNSAGECLNHCNPIGPEFAAGFGTANTGVTVDSEGDVFIAHDEGYYGSPSSLVEEYGPQANHPKIVNEALEVPEVFEKPVYGLAVANSAPHLLYVANGPAGTVDIFKPEEPKPPAVTTGPVSAATSDNATVTGTVKPNDEETEYAIEYGETEAYGTKGTTLELPGVAEPVAVSEVMTGLVAGRTYHYRFVASNAKGGRVYGADGTFVLPRAPVVEPAEALGTAVILKGELNPEGAAGRVAYQFAYNSGDSCLGGVETPLAEIAEGKEARVEAEIPGLDSNTKYTYCLIATRGFGIPVQSAEVSFQTTMALLRITGESFASVGSGGGVVQAQINPGQSPIETYDFEYGPTTAYGSSTPVENLHGVNESVGVSAQLSGLAPDTEYHFRLVATGAGGETTQGRDVVFRTRPSGLLSLPDGRVYEMVSPASEHDANVFVPEIFTAESQLPRSEGVQSRLPFQASVAGDEVVYGGESSEGGNGLDSEGAGEEYLATRSAEGGWSQSNIQPPGVIAARYQAFSDDLSTGILEWAENGSGETHGPLFLRNDTNGNYSALSPTGDAVYAGASANRSDLFMAPGGLFDSAQGHVSQVNVLPNGDTEADATFGSPALRNPEENPPDLSHVISTDGSRVFWSGATSGGLYVRENPGSPESPRNGQGECTVPGDACTVQVDAKAPGAAGSSDGGRFWTASSDGSLVLFTDESKLTVDSTAVPGAPDLYEYQVNSKTGKPGTLIDLTVHAGEPAGVQGLLGASEDGSYVYFVADGALAEGAQPQSCEAEPLQGEPTGGCNLYVEHEGTISFITRLSSQDGIRVMPAAGDANSSGEFGDWQPGLGHRTAEVTPDGQSLVFASNRSLTGYDNDAEHEGRLTPVDEVFVYRVGGGLSCVSCDPGREAPSEYGGGAAGFLPVSWSDTYLPRWVSEDGGRVFFDSPEPLAVQDSNGKQDVYEWERDGTGSCQAEGGCVYLLSRGASDDASWLLGASASGNDVFIISRAQLVEEGQGETYAVYDARVDGARPPAQAGCPAGGCQVAPGLPPVFSTPPSSTFEGVGNFPPASLSSGSVKAIAKAKVLTRAQKLAGALRVCRRARGRARRSCDAQARRRYARVSKAKKHAKRGG
jgi:WD40-like Beta Propeller Repeat